MVHFVGYQSHIISFIQYFRIEKIHIFPVAFFVVKNKNCLPYNLIFDVLKSLCGNFCSAFIKIDFELGAINVAHFSAL